MRISVRGVKPFALLLHGFHTKQLSQQWGAQPPLLLQRLRERYHLLSHHYQGIERLVGWLLVDWLVFQLAHT